MTTASPQTHIIGLQSSNTLGYLKLGHGLDSQAILKEGKA
jgi:hypothetical protein